MRRQRLAMIRSKSMTARSRREHISMRRQKDAEPRDTVRTPDGTGNTGERGTFVGYRAAGQLKTYATVLS